jgi:DNA ligase-1
MIKKIFDEISAEHSTNQKMVILGKYKDNELLKRVLYLANSKRIKFYIKQIPEYRPDTDSPESLTWGLDCLKQLSERKVTGHEASKWLQVAMSGVSPDDAYIIERIIEKDCKIGMGTSNINKVFPKLIEDTPYMGAKSFDEKLARKIFDKGGVGYSQVKMDGRYCNAIIRCGEVELESRQGEPTEVDGAKFLTELSELSDCVLNGELTMDGVSRYESNGIIASIIDICGKRNERSESETDKKIKAFTLKHGDFEKALNSIRYTVWDIITIDEYFDTHSKTSYSTRLANLKEIIVSIRPSMVSLIDNRIVKTYGEAMEHFQEMLSLGLEGTILKAASGNWKDGKPNWQIKMKLEMDVDLRITGFNYGGKGTKNEHLISSFNAESSDGLVKTSPQGLKEDVMKYVTENQDKLLGTILQCRSCGLSKDSKGNHSLLHPSFVELRGDKDTCDSLESIKEIENMVKTLSVN